MEEAARIDGCSELGLLWKIVLPLSKPICYIYVVLCCGTLEQFLLGTALHYGSDKMAFAGDAATDRNVVPICSWRYEFYGSELCAATGAVD